MTPRQVWERAHEFVRAFDLAGFASLFREDGVLETPFAPAGMPGRIEGRENIARVLGVAAERAKAAGRRIVGYENVVVHQTIDPEVIVVEFTLVGAAGAARTPYRSNYVQVVTVRAGQIVRFRDYIDPKVFAAVGS
jgi:hypothetical protein